VLLEDDTFCSILVQTSARTSVAGVYSSEYVVAILRKCSFPSMFSLLSGRMQWLVSMVGAGISPLFKFLFSYSHCLVNQPIVRWRITTHTAACPLNSMIYWQVLISFGGCQAVMYKQCYCNTTSSCPLVGWPPGSTSCQHKQQIRYVIKYHIQLSRSAQNNNNAKLQHTILNLAPSKHYRPTLKRAQLMHLTNVNIAYANIS
jgi:hypothetical protein